MQLDLLKYARETDTKSRCRWNAHIRPLYCRKGDEAMPTDKNDKPMFNISKKCRKSVSLSAAKSISNIVEMETYTVYLVALVFLNIALAYHRYNAQKHETSEETLALPNDEYKAAATKFKWEYFSLYGLAMAADWLQVSQRLFP